MLRRKNVTPGGHKSNKSTAGGGRGGRTAGWECSDSLLP